MLVRSSTFPGRLRVQGCRVISSRGEAWAFCSVAMKVGSLSLLYLRQIPTLLLMRFWEAKSQPGRGHGNSLSHCTNSPSQPSFLAPSMKARGHALFPVFPCLSGRRALHGPGTPSQCIWPAPPYSRLPGYIHTIISIFPGINTILPP